MTRARHLLTALAALALLAVAMPAPAAARARALKVAVPSPGDVTLMHVEFKRSAATRRRLPRFRRLPAATRRTLRRARVSVVGSTLRMSRTRVIGTVVVLRKKSRAAAPSPRAVKVFVNRPFRARLTQRNVLRRRAPRSVRANAAQLPPFTCDRLFEVGRSDGDELGGYTIKSELVYEEEAPELAYELLCDVYSAELEPLLQSIGSRFPVDCTFTSTYIGPATDSEGNVITEPSFLLGMSCSKTIDELALVLHDSYVKYCEDSADRPCQVVTTLMPMDTALFPYRVRAGVDTSLVIRGEPPLEKGERYEVLIDLVDGGQLRDDQVM